MWQYRSLDVSVAMRACMRGADCWLPDWLWNLGVGTVCFQQAPQKILIHDDVSEPRTLCSRSTPTPLGIRGGPWGESGPLALFVLWEPCCGPWELGAARDPELLCCTDAPEIRKTAPRMSFADSGPAGMATGDVVFGGGRGGSWEDVYTRLPPAF